MTKPDRILQCPECQEQLVIPDALILLDVYQCHACGYIIDFATPSLTWILAPLALVALAVVLVV